jgi:hypothetical protein
MQTTRLGRTALEVSRLCLGTMNFGPQTTEPDAFRIMDRALELGINFFDTANVYGWKKSEVVDLSSSSPATSSSSLSPSSYKGSFVASSSDTGSRGIDP